jgi:flagellar hook protein FlgE
MTISSSLNAGVSGLAANANKLATISDNIANSSTFGYKRVETDFSSMVISGGSDKYSAGGVRASTQRLIDQSGALVASSSGTDIAVSGRGFFPVTDMGSIGMDNTRLPMRLATTGSFKLDEDGYLRTPSGIVLMGWPAAQDGTIPPYPRDTTRGLSPVQVSASQFVGEPTTRVNLGINLPATDTIGALPGNARQLSVEYFDDLGMSRTLDLAITPVGLNQWQVEATDSSSGNRVGDFTIDFNAGSPGAGTPSVLAGNVYDPADGTTVIGAIDPATGVAAIEVGTAGQVINLSFGEPGTNGGLTQLSDIYAPTGISKDGAGVGNMTGIEIDEGGHVIANFDTGVSRTLYQVPILDVGNPNELTPLDNQTYMPSAFSGGFFMWDAGDGPTGDLVSYALEGSTTDVAQELTNLIQTQRAYSSSRPSTRCCRRQPTSSDNA